jgi:hypothetical protein
MFGIEVLISTVPREDPHSRIPKRKPYLPETQWGIKAVNAYVHTQSHGSKWLN